MKRFVSLTALALLLCVLLVGCSDGYSSTPMEAYLKAYSQGESRIQSSNDIGAEIDCISLTDTAAIWFAVASDESTDDCIIHVNMSVKDGKYRFFHDPHFTYISDLVNLQDRPTLNDLGFYACITESDSGEYQSRTLYYSFVLTELLPEMDEEHDYTIKHYTVRVNGEDTDLTLVYYFEEV